MRATLRLEVEVCASSPVAAHLTTCCLERDTAGAVQFALRWVFDTRLEAEMGGNTVSAVRVENRIESSDGVRRGVGDGQYDGHAGGTHRVGAPTRAEVGVTMVSDVIVFARAFNTAPDVMPGSNRMATCADLVSSPSLRERQNSITTYKVNFLTGYVCSVLPDRLGQNLSC
jgi:hypothetical protein